MWRRFFNFWFKNYFRQFVPDPKITFAQKSECDSRAGARNISIYTTRWFDNDEDSSTSDLKTTSEHLSQIKKIRLYKNLIAIQELELVILIEEFFKVNLGFSFVWNIFHNFLGLVFWEKLKCYLRNSWVLFHISYYF